MIDPLLISTIRIGQLTEAPFDPNGNIPHEVGTDLRRGTNTNYATFIAGLIGAMGGLSFLPITITNGQLLPSTTTNEWFLAGKGTYHQSGGFPDIVCTQELNAIIGNGTNWVLGVEIPITFNPPASMISQSISSGVTNYAPSENAVFLALQSKISNIYSIRFAGAGQTYTLPTGAKVMPILYIDGYPQYLEDVAFLSDLNTFTILGSDVTFKTTIDSNSQIIIPYYL